MKRSMLTNQREIADSTLDKNRSLAHTHTHPKQSCLGSCGPFVVVERIELNDDLQEPSFCGTKMLGGTKILANKIFFVQNVRIIKDS